MVRRLEVAQQMTEKDLSIIPLLQERGVNIGYSASTRFIVVGNQPTRSLSVEQHTVFRYLLMYRNITVPSLDLYLAIHPKSDPVAFSAAQSVLKPLVYYIRGRLNAEHAKLGDILQTTNNIGFRYKPHASVADM